MVTAFLIIFTIVIAIIAYRSNLRVFYNDVFYLIIWWVLILGIYKISGVQYGTYNITLKNFVFLFACFGIYFLGRYFGSHTIGEIKGKKIKTIQKREYNYLKLKKQINMFICIGIIGVFVYSFDFVRLNSLKKGGRDYNISIFGTIGNLLVPALYVSTMYMLSINLKEKRKIKISTIILLVLYCIPNAINSSRGFITWSIIGVIVTFSSYYNFNKCNIKELSINVIVRRIMYLVSAFVLVGIFLYISEKRFTFGDISNYLNQHYVPKRTINEANSWGVYSFFYYNIISYFGHQIPFLEYVLENYSGEHYWGLYEFNIIARRVPILYMRMKDSISYYIPTVFSASWETWIGSLYIDFGYIGTIIILFIYGRFSSTTRRKMLMSEDVHYVVLNTLVCVATMSTVQLGPFYEFSLFGCFIWWGIISGTLKNVQIIDV